jgi:hypothetical protein
MEVKNGLDAVDIFDFFIELEWKRYDVKYDLNHKYFLYQSHSNNILKIEAFVEWFDKVFSSPFRVDKNLYIKVESSGIFYYVDPETWGFFCSDGGTNNEVFQKSDQLLNCLTVENIPSSNNKRIDFQNLFSLTSPEINKHRDDCNNEILDSLAIKSWLWRGR